jgi:ABC-2 type transport system permease protein
LRPDLVGSTVASAISATPVDPAGDPFYLQTWFVLVLVVAWTVLPVAVGYWRFDRADLG